MKNQTPVSHTAVISRINRRLAKDGQTLKASRQNSRWANDNGSFYIVDTDLNSIVAQHVCLDSLAIELGVLSDCEFLCWPEEFAKLEAA